MRPQLASTPVTASLVLFAAASAASAWSVSVLDDPTPRVEDMFGRSIASNPERILIGAPGDRSLSSGSFTSGQVHVYNAETLDLIRTLDNPVFRSGSGDFGISVAVDGDIAVIGARADDTSGVNVGRAYAFNLATGNLLRTFTDPTPSDRDLFGNTVAVSGNLALVGADFDDTNASNSGQAHLFDIQTGGLLRTLNSPEVAANAQFGSSVAISGNSAFISDKASSLLSQPTTPGQVHAFDVSNGSLERTFQAPQPNAGDLFGSAIALGDNRLLVGASATIVDGRPEGKAYLFDASSGDLLQTFGDPSGVFGGGFGRSVAISGDRVLIGSRGATSSEAATAVGQAYLFDANTGALLKSLSNPSPADFDDFGIAVALAGDSVLVGASSDGTNGRRIGQAYVFEEAPAPFLDQESFGPVGVAPGFNANVGFGGAIDHAQTLTVGVAGTLEQIDLFLRREDQTTEPLMLDIRTVDSEGFPTTDDSGATVLGSIEIPASEVTLNGDWLEISVSALGIVVEEGETLALVLQSNQDLGNVAAGYSWLGDQEGDYTGGSSFDRFGAGAWRSVFDDSTRPADLYFRTFVSPVAVPEPTGVAMLAAMVPMLIAKIGRSRAR